MPGRFEPLRRRHPFIVANHVRLLLLMSEPTPAIPPTEEAKKRLREKVDKLLAQDAFKSEASIVLNGRTMKYSAVAAFVPVTAGGLDEKRGATEAALFTTSYFLAHADP